MSCVRQRTLDHRVHYRYTNTTDKKWQRTALSATSPSRPARTPRSVTTPSTRTASGLGVTQRRQCAPGVRCVAGSSESRALRSRPHRRLRRLRRARCVAQSPRRAQTVNSRRARGRHFADTTRTTSQFRRYTSPHRRSTRSAHSTESSSAKPPVHKERHAPPRLLTCNSSLDAYWTGFRAGRVPRRQGSAQTGFRADRVPRPPKIFSEIFSRRRDFFLTCIMREDSKTMVPSGHLPRHHMAPAVSPWHPAATSANSARYPQGYLSLIHI